uniref:Uncharacterized protein n=1 Tax=Chelydra serpentina TaxID=8475 RepID=A0A8C3S0R6_CHESE
MQQSAASRCCPHRLLRLMPSPRYWKFPLNSNIWHIENVLTYVKHHKFIHHPQDGWMNCLSESLYCSVKSLNKCVDMDLQLVRKRIIYSLFLFFPLEKNAFYAY